jgi:hypothetical protein
LRVRSVSGFCEEALIMDFDRPAIAAFLEKNKGKTVTATLTLFCLGSEGASPVKAEVATLDTTAEWGEGDKSGDTAAKGEVTLKAARYGEAQWTDAAGKTVVNLQEVFLDASNNVKGLANASPMTVEKAQDGKQVSVVLDAKFVQHLATSPVCKGLVIFIRGEPEGRLREP